MKVKQDSDGTWFAETNDGCWCIFDLSEEERSELRSDEDFLRLFKERCEEETDD